MVHACDPGSFWRHLVYQALQSVLPLINLYLLKLLVDSVQQGVSGGGDATTFVGYLLAM